MLSDRCEEDYRGREWYDEDGGYHRVLHATAHAYVEQYGRGHWRKRTRSPWWDIHLPGRYPTSSSLSQGPLKELKVNPIRQVANAKRGTSQQWTSSRCRTKRKLRLLLFTFGSWRCRFPPGMNISQSTTGSVQLDTRMRCSILSLALRRPVGL